MSDENTVMAKVPDNVVVDSSVSFELEELHTQLGILGCSDLYLDLEVVNQFIGLAKENHDTENRAFKIAYSVDATITINIADDCMLANMIVAGSYRGQGVSSQDIIKQLKDAGIIKGINKQALKKVLHMSHTLSSGEQFIQPIAKGLFPVNGKNAQFQPLIKDVRKQVLAPKASSSDLNKIDLKDFGKTITVGVGNELMKRIPPTNGEPGFTVKGEKLLPKEGEYLDFKLVVGSKVSSQDSNLLIATHSGMPIISERGVAVENTLCLKNVGIDTGHIKFKGHIVVQGNIEAGMVVKATESITVGGFIESADVQAQGDISVAKGIIGHIVTDEETYTCRVKSNGNISANYAQYSELQAGESIHLSVYSLNNKIQCGQDLLVIDKSQENGTLSGGTVKVGRRVHCVELGVEGDTLTKVHAFARYDAFKDRMTKYNDLYRVAQEQTMEVVRAQISFQKKPKSERGSDEEMLIKNRKEENNQQLKKIKNGIEQLNSQFESCFKDCTIEVKSKVYTRVTIQFGNEKIVTKRIHGPSIFSFNQYEILCESLLSNEDISA
ncbi:FapA family protein [Vibrio sp. 10N.286.49.B3]|uniref:DUF342 domain-containing protein n=1 Tax=Vibrio sp. 10N.286.49.B3 TaxID=1880855 RepID=UPI001F53AF86|nr:FapA family protein [Vibrio sp. 10N.286.49.B3]